IVSVTDCTCAVVSFQPTTITFRSPADCAAANATETVDCDDCGTAALPCTNAIGAWAFPRWGPIATVIAATRLTQPTNLELRFECVAVTGDPHGNCWRPSPCELLSVA